MGSATKVVIVSTLPASAGNSTLCVTLAQHLKSRGYAVHVCVLDSAACPAVNANVEFLAAFGITSTIFTLGRGIGIRHWLLNFKAFGDSRLRGDVLVSIGLGRAAGVLGALGCYKRRIGWLINHTPGLPHVRRMGRLMQSFNVVGAISPTSLRELRDCWNVAPSAEICWLPQFTTAPDSASVSKSPFDYEKHPAHQGRVGFLGHLKEEKGLRFLLQQWSRNKHLPDLVVMGDGPLRNEVELAAKDLSSGSAIHYLGHFDATNRDAALADFFSQIHHLVVPTMVEGEGMPTVIIEALRHGVPIVATRLGGVTALEESPLSTLPEVCTLCAPSEVIPVVAKLGRHFSIDERLQQKCFRTYEEAFGEVAVMRRWERALSGLATSNKSEPAE